MTSVSASPPRVFANTLIELANVPVLTLLMGMLNHIFELAWGTLTATAGQQLDNAPDKQRGLRSLEKLGTTSKPATVPAPRPTGTSTPRRSRKRRANAARAKVVDILDE